MQKIINKIIEKINIYKILIAYISILPIIDLVTSISARMDLPGMTIGILIKGLFLLFICGFCFFKYKFNDRKASTIFFLFLMLYETVYLVIMYLNKGIAVIPNEIKSSIKTFFAPIVIVVMYDIFKNEKINIKSRHFTYILVQYVLLILVANITGTSFNTYIGQKTGSIGWFYAGNDIGAILISLFPILYFNIIKTNSKILTFFMFVMVYVLFSIGTKVPIIGVILALVCLFFVALMNDKFISNKYKREKNIKFLIFLIIYILLLFPSSAFLNNINIHKNNIIDNNATSEEKKDMSELIYSGRREFKMQTLKRYNKASIVEKMFGMGFYNKNNTEYKLIEMDFYDLYFNHGIVGFCIYFSIFGYVFYDAIKNIRVKKIKDILKLNNVSYFISTILLFGIGFFSGHVFLNPTVSLYLALIYVILHNKIIRLNRKKEYFDNNKVTIMALHLKFGGVESFISTISSFLQKKYDVEIVSVYKFPDNVIVSLPKCVKITYLLPEDMLPNKDKIKLYISNKRITLLFKEVVKAIKILYLKKYRMIKYIKKCDSKIIISTRIEHNSILSEYGNDNSFKIATEHNYYSEKYSERVVNSCDYIDAFIVTTNDQKKYYENLFYDSKTKVYKIAIAVPFKSESSSKLKKYNLVSIGRLSEEKGFSDLIELFSMLHDRNPKYKLKIIGDGEQRKLLEEKINEKKLSNNVEMCGYKNSDEINEILLNSSIYLMTSHTESFGIVLIEAMRCGVPCIIFDSAKGACEIVKNNYNGFIIKKRNMNKYVEAIIKLSNDRKMLKNMSKNAIKTASNFSTEKIEEQWLNLLENI